MKSSCSRWALVAVVAVVLLTTVSGATASGWLSVQDASGITWARVKIVNNSAADTAWVISNGRTALASTAAAAETDASANWDGVVAAATEEYVWVYGLLSGAITASTADGTLSGYLASAEPNSLGDGEWVITVDATGNVTGAIEMASYTVPSRSGTLADMSVEE